MKLLLLLIFATCFTLPSFADTTYVYQLPFEESFYTGSFTTNEWTVEGMNWVIEGQQGNPTPSSKFVYYPGNSNYSKSLISVPINGAWLISGEIYLDYDIMLDDNLASGKEKMAAEVFNGTQWVAFYTDTATGDFDWKRNHVNITEAAKGNTFQIRFRAYGMNTNNINYWSLDNINVYRHCPKPQNLDVSWSDPANGLYILEWEAPDNPISPGSEWIQWDDNANFTGIGTSDFTTWSAAVRFTPSQLAEFTGGMLTKIRFFPAEADNSSFVLKVWTGPNAGTLVVSQQVETYIRDKWNEFALNTPVPITGTTEMWIGYDVTQVPEDFPAGCDDGPEIDGFGNMIYYDSVWTTVTALNGTLNYNWNIQGRVERDLQGYNIFLEEEWLAFTPNLWYEDTIPNRTDYCYNVSAVYQDCESELSNPDCIWVSTQNIDAQKTSIYPNPASNKVEFELDDEIRQFVIYNLLGEVISEVNVNSSKQTISLDLTNYQNGIYLVKFIASTGESTIRKLIVTK